MNDIFHIPDLAGGVAFKCKHGIVGAHPVSVIYHLDEISPAVFHTHRNGCGTRIYAILHQFFNHRDGAFYNLARGNHIAHIFRENIDSCHILIPEYRTAGKFADDRVIGHMDVVYIAAIGKEADQPARFRVSHRI